MRPGTVGETCTYNESYQAACSDTEYVIRLVLGPQSWPKTLGFNLPRAFATIMMLSAHILNFHGSFALCIGI